MTFFLVDPLVALPLRLPSPSLLSSCRCTVHLRPSPSPLCCRCAVALPLLPLLPLPLLLLLPPSPPPTFADPFIGWLLCRCVAVSPSRCHCRRCRCCHYCRHHQHQLLLIPLLVGCCVAVCAVDRHLLPGVLTLLIREFAHLHCLRHRQPWAAQ